MPQAKKPKVFIGVPLHGGDMTAGTAMTVIQAASTNLIVNYHVMGLSLLAKNFNHLFVKAWKHKYDYFLLLHSDISVKPPQGWSSWIDCMVARMIELQCACLSVVSPIKSFAGHTSTALELHKDNPYNMRRLTVQEAAALRSSGENLIDRNVICEMFGVKPKNAGALLINTGCLLMDLKNFDWTQWEGFGIDDCIAWSKNGVPSCYTVPEDWKLSRFLHEQGWPYYATVEVPLYHFGTHTYENVGEIGEPHDTVCGQIPIDEWRDNDQR